MDKIVKVRRSFLNEMRGFCNRFASRCKDCFRYSCDCEMYDVIRKAKSLIFIIDNLRDAEEERFYSEHPFEELCDKVMKGLEQANGRPLKSVEISIGGVSKQRKANAIKKLLKRGRIELMLVRGERFYVVSNDGKQHNTHNKRNTPYGIRHQ